MSSLNLDLEFLGKFTNRFEVRLDKYRVPNLLKSKNSDDNATVYKKDNFPIPQDTPDFAEPSVSTWAFMNEMEVTEILNCETLCTVKKLLENKFCKEYPKEAPRKIIIDLMYSLLKFAITSQYNVEQTATLLSIFYLSHRFFSMSYNSTAEDVFFYFKEILTYHCLDITVLEDKNKSAECKYQQLINHTSCNEAKIQQEYSQKECQYQQQINTCKNEQERLIAVVTKLEDRLAMLDCELLQKDKMLDTIKKNLLSLQNSNMKQAQIHQVEICSLKNEINNLIQQQSFVKSEFCPVCSKIFTPEDSYKIINYFCKIYLRHLPIIRLLSLPNFGYELSLIIEEPPVIKRKKPAKEKGKKGKKDKKEKKGKKGKK